MLLPYFAVHISTLPLKWLTINRNRKDNNLYTISVVFDLLKIFLVEAIYPKQKNGKAIIGDECATCLACFHWCPREAVYMSKQEGIERRSKYHHPDVELLDFILE